MQRSRSRPSSSSVVALNDRRSDGAKIAGRPDPSAFLGPRSFHSAFRSENRIRRRLFLYSFLFFSNFTKTKDRPEMNRRRHRRRRRRRLEQFLQLAVKPAEREREREVAKIGEATKRSPTFSGGRT